MSDRAASDSLIDRCRGVLERAARAREPDNWSVFVSKSDLRELLRRADCLRRLGRDDALAIDPEWRP